MAEQKLNTIVKDIVVTMDYTLEVNGKVVDSGPIQFLHGHGNIISGLEEKVGGMTLGEEKAISVKAEDAYGIYDPELELEVPLSNFPDDFEIQLGHPMRIQDDAGRVFTAVAIAISDEQVTLNLNHPLAGKDLLFNVKVIELRSATALEIENGCLASACSGCSSGDCNNC